MKTNALRPLIGVAANARQADHRRHRMYATAERYVESLIRMMDCIPVLIPPVGGAVDVADLVSRMDGFVLTGGISNVEPHHYDGPAFPPDEPVDPGRDAVVLPLVRACITTHVPVFGICRGIQEINVALGGSLYYRIHQVPGKDDHRMPRREDVTTEEIYRLRHPVRLTPQGMFRSLAGQDEIMVNSLHGQGVDRLGEGLVVEAVSHDGVVEGLRHQDEEQFIVGVQWHAEYEPHEHTLSRALYEAFGEAARARAARRLVVTRSA